MKNIILIGPQGSGKGTQAKIIESKFSIPHISTGDILREAIKKQTKMGLKAKEIINQGKLVPDEIVNGIVKDRLSEEDAKEGFILDGYPRNIGQAKELDKFSEINYVIELSIPDEISIQRLSSRRQCKKCGTIFGRFNPPKKEGICDKCGGELYQREDDKEESIKNRLEIYHNETEPIIEYYKQKKIDYQIDGTGTPEEVKDKIVKIIS